MPRVVGCEMAPIVANSRTALRWLLLPAVVGAHLRVRDPQEQREAAHLDAPGKSWNRWAERTTADTAPNSAVSLPGITVKGTEHNVSWWGFPNYANSLDFKMPTWTELARNHGQLGRQCTITNSRQQCGTQFVCRESVCSECMVSKECPSKFKCDVTEYGRRLCIPRSLVNQWHWREVVATILIVFTAMLSAAAGMGGGGVYVPLLLLLLQFSAKEAVPLSQAMIVGGATVNVIMFSGEKHPKNKQKPKIDYDVVMMLNPGLAAGVLIGVACHIISPQWLIVATLLVTLVLALHKSVTKGVQQWQKESKAAEAAALAASENGGGGAPAGPPVKMKFAPDIASFIGLATSNRVSMGLIFGCWATFFLMNVFKAPQCTVMYWLQQAATLLFCAAFTIAGARVVTAKANAPQAEGEGVLKWTPTNLWLYPLFSTVAGFLGGFLGIGGGIIMGPLLLELGMLPEVNQATTAMFVFLSSSLATIQFLVLGYHLPEYVCWFMAWVIAATFVGQTLIDYMLKKTGRSSVIVLSIAGIIAFSLVMMTLIGTLDVITDLSNGAYMGFTPYKLCQR